MLENPADFNDTWNNKPDLISLNVFTVYGRTLKIIFSDCYYFAKRVIRNTGHLGDFEKYNISN